VSGQRCEHGAVRPGKAWPDAEPAAQDRVLMAQRKQLDILGALRAGEQQEQSEEPQEDQVEHAQRHEIRPCHPRRVLRST
jgi:hypothetical protein